MSSHVRAIHVLAVNGDETLTDERLAQHRPVAISQGELPVGLCVRLARYVDNPGDEHLPQHITLDERPSADPLGERTTDGGLP